MPQYKTRILSTGSLNRTSKKALKASVYGIDVSDIVKDIGVKIDQNSLKLTEHSPYIVTVTVFCYRSVCWFCKHITNQQKLFSTRSSTCLERLKIVFGTNVDLHMPMS